MTSERPTRTVSPQRKQKHRGGLTEANMPHADHASQHVYRFTAGGNRVFNAEVVDHADRVAYRFVTEGKRMTLYDVAEGREVGSVLWGAHSRVTWEGVETKLGKFICSNSGNTGPLFEHDGILYNWLQEKLYALVRTTPGAVRMATIYNDGEKPEVEITPEGQAIGSGLLAEVVFVTALFECNLWKNPGFSGSPKLNRIMAAIEHEDHTKIPSEVDTNA